MSQQIPSPQEDKYLMTRLAEGDKTALAELVRRHQRRVVNLAYRTIGDWSLAEDIGQETFLRVWRAARHYQPDAQFTTWLYRIVINLCLDSAKKRKPVTGSLPETADAGVAPPMSTLLAQDCAAEVQAAVNRLPERQRVAVVLHRFCELPIRQITEITGWSESTVESLLVRAYSGLRVRLKKLRQSEASDRRRSDARSLEG